MGPPVHSVTPPVVVAGEGCGNLSGSASQIVLRLLTFPPRCFRTSYVVILYSYFICCYLVYQRAIFVALFRHEDQKCNLALLVVTIVVLTRAVQSVWLNLPVYHSVW